MSQEKVDRYKAQKANRKQTMKKEKRTRLLVKIGTSIIGIALVGWIGYSAYNLVIGSIPRAVTEVDLAAISEYENGLNAVAEEGTSEGSDDTKAADDSTDKQQDDAEQTDNDVE